MNFSDLKTRVQDDLDRSDMGTQIDRDLRRAVEHYERQRWWFNETQGTLTTSSSLASYSLPSDFLFLDEVEVTINSRTLKMNEIQWGRYMEEHRYQSSTGQPWDYAYYADQLWLGPVPNSNYVVTLHYVRTLGSFSDQSENAWTNFASDLISARALKTLGARPLQLANGTVITWQELERQAYNSLCNLSEQRVMTGKARPWIG